MSLLPLMEKSKGWYRWAWDVIVGCRNDCDYCYARKKIEARGKNFSIPEFRQYLLNEPFKVSPSMIFVNQLCDIMGDWLPKKWVNDILNVCYQLPEHTFVFITKLPQNYRKFKFSDNCILGVTVESPEKWWRVEEVERYKRTMCSIEPILGDFTGYDFSQFEFIVAGCLIGTEDKQFYDTIKHDKIYYTR